MFKRIITLSIFAVAVAGIVGLASAPSASAADPAPLLFGALTTEEKCGPGEVHPTEYNGDTDVRSCCPNTYGNKPNSTQCFFAKYLNPTVNLAAIVFGIIDVISIVSGGILISSSAGDSGKYAKGRQRIINALLALAAFIFFYAFMQYLIPGGFGA
jgi:hypothetical protein